MYIYNGVCKIEIIVAACAHIHSREPRAQAYVPLLESFGLETDIRTFTMGQASVLSQFDHW
jgi:translation elongation factor EF-G